MNKSFFPTRALLWAFWANILFILGMIGYFLMDGFDYIRPNALSSSLSSTIYVILALIFVVDSTLQLISIYNLSRNTHRYYIMVLSSVSDQIGSDAYFLGALFTATAFTSSKTISTCNIIGVVGFVIGALINMMVRGSSVLYSWANSLNLLGALLYLLAVFITIASLPQLIVILGDAIYLIDAILYMICWFSDRQLAVAQGEHILLVNK